MIEVGRVCVKTAGRDAGGICVIVHLEGKNMALIDGETRRRKVNIAHLEPTSKKVTIQDNADHAAVKTALKDLAKVRDTKPKQAGEKPVKARIVKKDSAPKSKPEPQPQKSKAPEEKSPQ